MSGAVAFEVVGLSVRWYALLYVVALGVGWAILPYMLRQRGVVLSHEQRFAVLVWVAAGVIVGGRVGYVLLYEPMLFFAQPQRLFALWEGGMSAHGGFVGVAITLWLAARTIPAPYLVLADSLVVPTALGLALGRLGNFINQELYVTPGAASVAIGTHLVIAGVCYWYSRVSSGAGRTTGLFLVLYALGRLATEWMREPQWPLVSVGPLALAWGQLYSIPLLLVGIWLWHHARSGR